MNIYDIARLAGVSPSTVSKVINGRNEIGEETKSRIQAIIQQYGYVPKISANSPTNIGVFTHLDNPFTSGYLNELLVGISEYFFPRDFGLLLLPAEQTHLDRKGFQVFCHKQRLAGGIFLDLAYDENYVEQIAGVIPLVTVNADFQGDELYAVMSDDYAGCTQAIEYLISMGHQRIAFATSERKHCAHRLRMQAYKDVLTRHGIPADNRLIFPFSRDFETVYDSWDEMQVVPTAIVAINDQEALKIISFLQTRNVKVPRDMSIVGFDNYSFVEHLSPPLTTVRQRLHDVSKQAATILYERILRSTLKFEHKYMFEEELIVRRSVADIRNRTSSAYWTPRAIGE